MGLARASLIGGAAAAYQIDNSLIFNDDDSAALSANFGATGEPTDLVVSTWVKCAGLTGAKQELLQVTSGTDTSGFQFTDTGQLEFWNHVSAAYTVQKQTTKLFRDTNSWYHIFLYIDTNNATAEDRFQIWINGERITDWDVNTLAHAQNDTVLFGGDNIHYIGKHKTAGRYFDGQFSKFEFVYGGTAPLVTDFGELNPDTNQWIPKAFTGSYGAEGFHLDFGDDTSATTLGYDVSGNDNHWTPSGIATTDQTTDTPTNNFCTLNPLDTSLSGAILSEGNLHIAIASAAYDGARGTIQIPTTGTWYFEFTPTNIDYNKGGIATHDFVLDATLPHTSSKACVYNDHATYVSVEGVNKTSYWSVAPDTATVGVCVDMDAGTISWQNTTDGRGSTHSFDATLEWYPFAGAYTGELNINFGQKAFTLTPPSGFLALSTANLPEPDIILSGEYFKALTYTGNEVAIGSGGNAITGVGFQPDLVWMKSRDEGTGNYTGHNSLIDSVRGVGLSLFSNLTNAESVVQAESLSTFDTDGFTLGNKESVNYLNDQFISWNWKESALAGFDIVSDVGTGSAHTIAHNLGVVPDMIIRKSLDEGTGGNYTGAWPVYHSANTAAPETDVLYLQSTDATADNTVWNDTAPTSSVFSVSAQNVVNYSGDNFITYLFASVEGFSKFGSYTGNGSTDGPFVNCNMKVGYLRIKRTDTTGSWQIRDSAVNNYNAADKFLKAEGSDAEGSAQDIDFTSNGFKLRNTGAATNASGGTYIYTAFAESPQKYSNGR